jgi:hypothetical protein
MYKIDADINHIIMGYNDPITMLVNVNGINSNVRNAYENHLAFSSGGMLLTHFFNPYRYFLFKIARMADDIREEAFLLTLCSLSSIPL